MAERFSVLVQQNLGNVGLWNAGIPSTQTPFVLKEPLEILKPSSEQDHVVVGRQTLIPQTPSSSFNILHAEHSYRSFIAATNKRNTERCYIQNVTKSIWMISIWHPTHSESKSSSARVTWFVLSSTVIPLSAGLGGNGGGLMTMLLASVPERTPSFDPTDGVLQGIWGGL